MSPSPHLTFLYCRFAARYKYDDLYRLISSYAASTNEAFTYDSVGNRLTSADTTGDWTYNANNELQATDDTQFVYDENGNMISKTDTTGTTTYTYDVENRLVQISNPESQISNYYYDPFGRRLWKEVDGTTTYFMYADEGLLAELDDSGTETKTYGYVPNSTWTTDPLFMEEDNIYYFYHNDHLGTPQKMTSINGSEVWSAKYSSFGEADVDAESTVSNNLRFPGQYYDEEIGLHYNYHRYYEPTTGRYTNSDPIGLKESINLYLYSRDNPLRYIDPKGLSVLASCTYISGGVNPFGGGILKCTLEEIECFRNKREKADYIGVLGGLTYGSIPLGGVLTSMVFNNAGDVRDFTGWADIESLSAAIIFGKSWGQVCLGDAGCAYGFSDQLGYDASADLFVGHGWVYNIREGAPCCDY